MLEDLGRRGVAASYMSLFLGDRQKQKLARTTRNGITTMWLSVESS